MRDEVISEWVRPGAYELAACTLRVPALNFSVNLVVGEFDEFRRYVREEHGHELRHEAARAMAVCFDDAERTNWKFMILPETEWRAEDYGLLAHETHHMAHMALAEMGVTYGDACEEVYAHAQGHLTELSLRALVELGRARGAGKGKKRGA
jgi:hypothetical protein